MADLRYHWYAPTHGDARHIGGHDPDLAWTPAYATAVAREAERAGFDKILLPVGPTCADVGDPWSQARSWTHA